MSVEIAAKEFVAAQVDEPGILTLSQFTGAATLHLALMMSQTEQRTRMHSLRGIVQEFNVDRWAGRMLMDAARMRQQARLVRQMGARDVRTTTGGQV
jgi:trehalose-6-phosphate synthase